VGLVCTYVGLFSLVKASCAGRSSEYVGLFDLPPGLFCRSCLYRRRSLFTCEGLFSGRSSKSVGLFGATGGVHCTYVTYTCRPVGLFCGVSFVKVSGSFVVLFSKVQVPVGLFAESLL